MLRLYRGLITLLICFAVLISGCSDKRPETTLQVGTNLWPGYEPLHLAQSLEYFQARNIRAVVFPSASEVIRAFRNRVVSVAALTLDEALLLEASGIDIAVIHITDISHGADVMLSNPQISSMAQLQGKRVGLESTALGAYVLTRALEINHLKVSDVELVDLDVSEHEQAFVRGEVDAVVSFEPVKTKLLNRGAKVIFDSTQIPGEVVDVLVVRRESLETDAEQLKALIDGWYQALDYLHSYPEKSAAISGRHLGISAQEFLDSLSGLDIPERERNRRLLKQGELQQTAEKLQQVMLEHQLINGPEMGLNDLMDARFQ